MEQVPIVRYLLEQISYFCKKPPKGFEKYFEQGKSSAKPASSAAGEASAAKPKSSESSASKSPSSTPTQSTKNDWNFGMFANTNKQQGGGGRGGQGRPIGEGGDGNREKWLVFGAIGTVALLGSFAFFEMGYKEVSWKEFVTKYVSLLRNWLEIYYFT